MVRWNSLSVAEWSALEAVFWAGGGSRAALAGRLGFSKSKANGALAALIERGLVEQAGPQASSGGRRPEGLSLSHCMGALVGVDLGATSLDVLVAAPDLGELARHGEPIDVRAGPGVVLARVREVIAELLREAGVKTEQIIGIGMGVPGPVEFDSGLLVSPPIMPGWEGFTIREFLREHFRANAYIDNDVNVMALAELWRLQRPDANFIVVKVGTGIGCGVVCHGQVYRGADGAAGDVGHICVDYDGPRCHCGNVGCVEAMASGPAIASLAIEAARSGRSALLAETLAQAGTLTPEDVGRASRFGDVAANEIIQRSGQAIGRMLASVINFYNPSHVFIGGGIARIGPLLLASIRQSVYHRSLPLSTRHLELQYAPLAGRAGMIGAAVLALQETLRTQGGRR